MIDLYVSILNDLLVGGEEELEPGFSGLEKRYWLVYTCMDVYRCTCIHLPHRWFRADVGCSVALSDLRDNTTKMGEVTLHIRCSFLSLTFVKECDRIIENYSIVSTVAEIVIFFMEINTQICQQILENSSLASGTKKLVRQVSILFAGIAFYFDMRLCSV